MPRTSIAPAFLVCVNSEAQQHNVQVQVHKRHSRPPQPLGLEQAASELLRAFIVYKGACFGETAEKLQREAAACVSVHPQAAQDRQRLLEVDRKIARVCFFTSSAVLLCGPLLTSRGRGLVLCFALRRCFKVRSMAGPVHIALV